MLKQDVSEEATHEVLELLYMVCPWSLELPIGIEKDRRDLHHKRMFNNSFMDDGSVCQL
jgi:hypothetical protein